MTVEELALHVMAERGLNASDRALMVAIRKRVNSCLRHHRARGGPGKRLLWRVA